MYPVCSGMQGMRAGMGGSLATGIGIPVAFIRTTFVTNGKPSWTI